MTQGIQGLYDFIERATKSRKYPENTAQGLKAALKLFDAVLNEEERKSLDTFKNNIEQIYHSVSSKNGKNFNASTLAVYKSRISKLLSDYGKYGVDPTKMASWAPKVINRSPRKQRPATSTESMSEIKDLLPITALGMHKIELALRPGVKSVIIVPTDMTDTEGAIIKGVLESLVTKRKDK